MKNLLIISCLLFSIMASAQPRPINLNQAIATSLQNNYDIQLTRSDSILVALDYAYANYSLFPRLSANGANIYNKNDQRSTLADGSKRERNNVRNSNLTASLNLDWTLFDGFRMFIARKRLNQLVELGELQIKAQVVTTVAEVMTIYYDLVRQQQLLRSLQELIDLNNERLKLAQYRFDIGVGVKSDVLQAQIDLNAQRSAQLVQQTAINKLKEQLNQLLALPVANPFEIEDSTISFDSTLVLDSITTSAKLTNPELLLAEKNLAVAGLDLRLRRAERFPVLEFNSAYNFNRVNNNTVVNPSSDLFRQTKGLSYGFTATIPIFNGFTTRKLVRAAELTIQSQQVAYDRSLALINTSIATAYQDYDLYKRALAIELQNITLVRENINIARERYRLGVSTFIEYREAQQSLADANTRLIDARYNVKVAEIELMRLRGDLVR